MKNAPNVKQLPKDKFTEAIIFAGTDALSHVEHWTEKAGNEAGDKIPPIYLGARQLAELDNLRIIDKGRRCVRVYRAGDISPAQLLAIETQLALAEVKEARLFDGIHEQKPAEDWTPRLAELKEEAERGENLVNDMRKTSGQSALMDELSPHVESREDGVFWVTPKVDRDSGEIIKNEAWLCSPLAVIGRGYEDKEAFTILRWTPNGRTAPDTRPIRSGDIGEREGWRTLKAGGVNVTTKTALRAILADWIQQQSEGMVWSVTPRAGWHCGAYIMPDGSIIGEAEQPILFNGGTAAADAYSVAGTAESWRQNVARLAEGNPFQMLAVGVALTAPLLPLVGADGFGIHLYAQSTAGKTTAEDLASSLYGEPERQRLTWYGTSLGIANEAEAHNHGLMALDEVDQGANPRHVYTSAYTLFNGKGKLQGDKDGGNRALKYWKTAVISTGERDIETYLKGAGVKVNAGQLVRLLNIPVTRPTQLHGCASGKAHADALKAAWQTHHGAAGRAWIEYLSGHADEAQAAYTAAKARWQALIPDSYGEQVHRVIDRFAVIEAALLLGEEITGWNSQLSRDALQHVFNECIAVFGTGNKEIEQIIEQTEAFLGAYGMSRFAPLDYNPEAMTIGNLAGYRESENYGEPVKFYVLPKPFKEEVARGFDSAQFAKALHESGRLKRPTSGKSYQTVTPRLKHLGGIRQRAYLLIPLSADEE